MSCRSCLHSAWRPAGLWCNQFKTVPQRPCGDFVYEPGTDE